MGEIGIKMQERIKQILDIIATLAWRGFGVFLFIVGGAAGSGALITGDPFTGILIAWSTLMLGIVGAVGYAIAVTGKVTKSDVAKATQDAVQKHQEETKK
jgi:TRAP-type C4-dicarboxylate transport system permease small subunit